MSDQQLSEFDNLALTIRSSGESLEDLSETLKASYKMAELEAFALEAGIDAPARGKEALITQLIAQVTSGEDAVVDDTNPPQDEAPPDQVGVLPGEGGVRGVSLPEKVAKYRPEQLWPQILGWEIDQGLDEDARASYSEDECREYLAHLWTAVNMGRPITGLPKITEYEFRGIERG